MSLKNYLISAFTVSVGLISFSCSQMDPVSTVDTKSNETNAKIIPNVSNAFGDVVMEANIKTGGQYKNFELRLGSRQSDMTINWISEPNVYYWHYLYPSVSVSNNGMVVAGFINETNQYCLAFGQVLAFTSPTTMIWDIAWSTKPESPQVLSTVWNNFDNYKIAMNDNNEVTLSYIYETYGNYILIVRRLTYDNSTKQFIPNNSAEYSTLNPKKLKSVGYSNNGIYACLIGCWNGSTKLVCGNMSNGKMVPQSVPFTSNSSVSLKNNTILAFTVDGNSQLCYYFGTISEQTCTVNWGTKKKVGAFLFNCSIISCCLSDDLTSCIIEIMDKNGVIKTMVGTVNPATMEIQYSGNFQTITSSGQTESIGNISY